jgi:hypothetical protein
MSSRPDPDYFDDYDAASLPISTCNHTEGYKECPTCGNNYCNVCKEGCTCGDRLSDKWN